MIFLLNARLAIAFARCGHFEAVVPSYRIAHPALDGEDRQVGEVNVFPPGLRIERATEWRVCQYPGSRFRDDIIPPVNGRALARAARLVTV